MTSPARPVPGGRRPQAPFRRPAPKQPETLAELFQLLVKRFLIGLIWQVPLAAVLFFVVWIVHTFLLVYVNEGLNAGGSGPVVQRVLNAVGLGRMPFAGAIVGFGTNLVDSLIATRGRFLIGTLVWMLMGSLVSVTLVRFIRGPIRFFKDTFGTPSWMARTFKGEKSPLVGLSVLFAGAAAGTAFGVVVGHPRIVASRLLVLLLGLHGLTQILAHLNTLTGLVARLGWSDLQRWQGAATPLKRFRQDWLLSGVLGLSLGLLVASVTPFLLFCGCAGFLLMFVGAVGSAFLVVSKGRAGAAPAAMMLALMVGMTVLSLVAIPAYADDGGWIETGGSMQGWISSEGAKYAMGLGLGPAAGAAVGFVAGGAAGSLAGVAVGAGAGAGAGAGGAAGRSLAGSAGGGAGSDAAAGAGATPGVCPSAPSDAGAAPGAATFAPPEAGSSAGAGTPPSSQTPSGADQMTPEEKAERMRQLREQQQASQAVADACENKGKHLGSLESGADWIKWGCDRSLDVLANVTGPAGRTVKNVYTVVKGTGEGIGQAMADGTDIVKGAVVRTERGAVDLGLNVPGDKTTGALGETLPSLDPKAGVDWSGARTGFIKDALTGHGVDATVKGMVRDRFTTTGDQATESWGIDTVAKPVKDALMGAGGAVASGARAVAGWFGF